MAKFRVDLNMYGPYTNMADFRDMARNSGHDRMVYLARHSELETFRSVLKRPEVNHSPEFQLEQAKVAYVGITESLGTRFYKHHMIGNEALKEANLPKIEEYWAGFLHRAYKKPTDGSRHETRLKAAEDLLISWFVPPLNDQGVVRNEAVPTSDPEREIGQGATVSLDLEFHWWSVDGVPATAQLGFPTSLLYSESDAEITAIW